MEPDQQVNLEAVRTERLPAQERVAVGGEAGAALSAEEVYAQRRAETPFNGQSANPAFIP